MNAGFYASTKVSLTLASGDGEAATTNVAINTLPNPGYGKLAAQLVLGAPDVTDNTPTVTVIIQESFDNTNWATVVTFTAVTTSAASEIKKYTTGPLGPYLRANAVAETADEVSTWTGYLYVELTI